MAISSISSEVVYHTGQGPEPLVVKTDTKTSSPTKRDEKPVPHYLRSSAGSCHDLCKYGRKHKSEAKARRPLFYPVSGNKSIHGGARNRFKTGTPLAKTRKKPASKDEPLSNATVNKAKRSSETVRLMEIKGRSCGLLSLPIQEEELYEEPVSLGLSSTTPSSSDRGNASFSSSPSEMRKQSYEYPSSVEDTTPFFSRSGVESSESMQVHSEELVKEIVLEEAHGELIKDPEAVKEEIFSVIVEDDAAIVSSERRPVRIAEEMSAEQVNMATKVPVPAPTGTGSRRMKNMAKPTKPATTEVGKQKGTNASSKPGLVDQRNVVDANGASGKQNAIKHNSCSPMEKAAASFKPKLIKQKNLSFKKTAPEMAARVSKSKSPSPLKAPIARSPSQPKAPVSRPSSSLPKPPNGPPVRRARGNIAAETASISAVREKAKLKPPKDSPGTSVSSVPNARLWNYGGPKPAFPHKNATAANRAKPVADGGKTKERRRSTSLEPSYSSSFLTPPRTSSNMARRKSDEHEGISRHTRDRFSNGDIDRTRKGSTGVEDASSTPQKLKFRRGKVVVPEADNNNSSIPKRLRFRQARAVATEKQTGKEFHGRSSRTTREPVGEDGLSAAPAGVVLKHQEQGEKKHTGGLLFNQVIEETASKLMESRKSNVKALVGAFETVISLQESRAAP